MRKLRVLRNLLLFSGFFVLVAGSALAQNVEHAPPPPPYKKVSTLVKLPSFLPGLGTLYVNPKTLPYGPWLAYDHHGDLVSTIYMVPIKDFTDHKEIPYLSAPGGKVDHISIYFNAGHPGVPVPHYHIILWHIPRSQEVRVAK
jgi:hypothetical protein